MRDGLLLASQRVLRRILQTYYARFCSAPLAFGLISSAKLAVVSMPAKHLEPLYVL